MAGHRVHVVMWINGVVATLLLVVGYAGCAGRDRNQYPYHGESVASGAACTVCPAVATSPPLDWLGGHHLTRWHSTEPTLIHSNSEEVFLPSPELVPQENVPIPNPPPDAEERNEDTVLPGILPGLRSSTSPTRDSRLTQTAWPAVMPSETLEIARLPAVANAPGQAGAVWPPSYVAVSPGSGETAPARPHWWQYGPLVSRQDIQERETQLLRH